MPSDIPLEGGGRGDIIPPLMQSQLLKGHFLSDPLPSFSGSASNKRGNLWPPRTSKVKEELIKFPKEQIESSFIACSL